MKLPISWLKDYVAFEDSPEGLAQRLTFSGVEVEGIHRLGEGLQDLVVGEIVRFEKHPDADKLRLCVVHDGRADVPVVCGASNFAAGDKAAFAPVGARLPNGMAISKRKVRGIESHGMLCAEDELGLSEDHGGILLLPRDVPAGQPLAAALGLPDTVLELEITWNRADCLSVIGMAREVAALYGTALRLPDVAVPDGSRHVADAIAVAIEAPGRCTRYVARALFGLQDGPSPAWMQRRLKLSGVRPISAIVDVTNYVMLECGQPLHAFDHARLADRKIIVRLARPGERMQTLDGNSRALTPDMLVIADAAKPVAVAGVMGGAGSEVGAGTRDVLLESAAFDAPGTHRTAVALGMGTESSHRFERGVDPELADWASRRACALLLQTAGGEVACGVVDQYPVRPPPRQVTCRFARTRALLGVDVTADQVVKIFESLGLAVVSRSDESCTVRVPSFRLDVEIEADLIEEVARLHGLDKVPEPMPHASLPGNVDDTRSRSTTRLRERLVGLGLREFLNYTFMAERDLDRIAGDDKSRRLILPNPVSSDHAVMRPSLIPQLVLTLGHNMSRQTADLAAFELGRVFQRGEAGSVIEQERLAIGLMGRVGRGVLDGRRELTPADMFLWMKGLLAQICQAQIGVELELAPGSHPALESGWCLRVSANGAELGVAGLLRQALREDWRISGPVGIAELSLDPLLAAATRKRSFEALPTFPAVTHDMAMVVPEAVRHETIVETIRRAGPSELTDVRLFDIFRSKAFGDGRKSLAYSLVYRSRERTLTEDEVNRYDITIRQALKQALDAEIREG